MIYKEKCGIVIQRNQKVTLVNEILPNFSSINIIFEVWC